MLLENLSLTDMKELVEDEKLFVNPEYETVARTSQMKEHTVFSATGAGETAFRIVTFGKVPSKNVLRKAKKRGVVEIEWEGKNPTLINFDYMEKGTTKNQLALRLDEVKIKGDK